MQQSRKQALKNLQTEADTSYLYHKLAENEPDERIAHVFLEMSAIEKRHAEGLQKKYGLPLSLPAPSFRARVLNTIGKVFGYDYVLGVLMDTEKSISNAAVLEKRQQKIPIDGSEANHVAILRSLLDKEGKAYGSNVAKFERRHRSVGGNALRAAVLGGNDGLVSNFSLVMGVAGATAGQSGVLLSGIAGLLAGALSMALGEWISVKSSQELYENQMQIEKEELTTNPEDEERELVLIYMAKGVSEIEAKRMAKETLSDKELAYQVLIKEELGIDPQELKGSAVEAAVFSFILFAVGAIIPVLPFFFIKGFTAIIVSVLCSATGLFLIGSAITLFTGKHMLYSGFRQVMFGIIAAAITFGLGRLLGVSLS